MAFTTVGTTPGNYAVKPEDGFVSSDPVASARRTRKFTVLSGVSIKRGGAVQFSGGKIVPADASTKPSELAGIATRKLTGAASGVNSEVMVDQCILDGVEHRVLASDAAVAATDEGAGATVGADSQKVLMSGKTVDTGVFIINRVYNTTDKVVGVTINEGYNA